MGWSFLVTDLSTSVSSDQLRSSRIGRLLSTKRRRKGRPWLQPQLSLSVHPDDLNDHYKRKEIQRNPLWSQIQIALSIATQRLHYVSVNSPHPAFIRTILDSLAEWKQQFFKKQISICQAFSTLNPQIPKQQNLPASGSGGILHIYKLKSSEPERMYC